MSQASAAVGAAYALKKNIGVPERSPAQTAVLEAQAAQALNDRYAGTGVTFTLTGTIKQAI